MTARYRDCLILWVFWGSTLGGAATPVKNLVELEALMGSTVQASSVNGNRELGNPYYGIRNLFDDGENFIDGVNYTSWLSDAGPRHWIKVRFPAPSEVHTIMLEFTAGAIAAKPLQALAEPAATHSPQPSNRRPNEFAIDVTTLIEGEEVTRKWPSITVMGFRSFYPLDTPLQDVVELMIVFPGPSMIEVAEVEVLGKPSLPAEGIGQGPQLAEQPKESPSTDRKSR